MTFSGFQLFDIYHLVIFLILTPVKFSNRRFKVRDILPLVISFENSFGHSSCHFSLCLHWFWQWQWHIIYNVRL